MTSGNVLRCPNWNMCIGWIFPKLLNMDISFFHSSLPYSRLLGPKQNSAGRQRTEFCLCYLFPVDTDKQTKPQSVTRVSKCQNCRKPKSVRYQTKRLLWRRGLFSGCWLTHDLSSTTQHPDDYIANITAEASKENPFSQNPTGKALHHCSSLLSYRSSYLLWLRLWESHKSSQGKAFSAEMWTCCRSTRQNKEDFEKWQWPAVLQQHRHERRLTSPK